MATDHDEQVIRLLTRIAGDIDSIRFMVKIVFVVWIITVVLGLAALVLVAA